MVPRDLGALPVQIDQEQGNLGVRGAGGGVAHRPGRRGWNGRVGDPPGLHRRRVRLGYQQTIRLRRPPHSVQPAHLLGGDELRQTPVPIRSVRARKAEWPAGFHVDQPHAAVRRGRPPSGRPGSTGVDRSVDVQKPWRPGLINHPQPPGQREDRTACRSGRCERRDAGAGLTHPLAPRPLGIGQAVIGAGERRRGPPRMLRPPPPWSTWRSASTGSKGPLLAR